MESNSGLIRRKEDINTKEPIKVPAGKNVLGRIFNVIGEPIDNKDKLPKNTPYQSIHNRPLKFKEQSIDQKLFEIGIKVINLLVP